ncbi:hypothetical protein [Kaistella rhinocerotis]|uniref:hypothetical protein n=1 Tax=Kaistella rhinocerotis TaxID=3026437 RepID=UPI0025555D88|nr:hypothetical protein [Kaistella sp. Ran72]
MAKALLDKYKNDPAWAETIKLYSGLFDTQEERGDFIIDLSQSDTSLAADCELSSTQKNANTTENLKDIAVLKYLNGKEKPDLITETIVILKLGDENYFLDFLEKYYAKGNIRELFYIGLSHLNQETIFSLLSKLIRNRRNIYSKWIITYLLPFDKYSISSDQAAEAIEALTLIKKRISYKLVLKLICLYKLGNEYSKEYLINLLHKKGSRDSYKISKWLENYYQM